jgi:hypothetical protein
MTVSEEVPMTTISTGRRSKAQSAMAWSVLAIGLLFGSRASAATPKPSITVKKGAVTDSLVTLTVTGKNFTKRGGIDIEIDANGAFSGNLPQSFPHFTADKNGNFTMTSDVDLTSCRLGVFATNESNGKVSNGVDIDVESPCVAPHIKVYSPHGDFTIQFAGDHFTRNPGDNSSSVTQVCIDTNDGFTTHLGFVSNSDGTVNPSFHCHATGDVPNPNDRRIDTWHTYVLDDDTDTLSNTIDIVPHLLPKTKSTAIDCIVAPGATLPAACR